MSEPASMEQETDQALARLMALGLEAAEHVQAKLLAAETDAEIATRTLAFVRAARLVRQTAALRAKLARDQAREGRAAAREADDRAADPRIQALRRQVIEERKTLLREHLEERIWEEVSDDEKAEQLADVLGDLVEREALTDPQFLNRRIENQVEALAAKLGLAAAVDDDEPEAQEPPWPPAASNSS